LYAVKDVLINRSNTEELRVNKLTMVFNCPGFGNYAGATIDPNVPDGISKMFVFDFIFFFIFFVEGYFFFIFLLFVKYFSIFYYFIIGILFYFFSLSFLICIIGLKNFYFFLFFCYGF
jgi:hypothetical protein